MTNSTELYYAEMEAARNEVERDYFDARPQFDRMGKEGTTFRAGFERAFQKLWNQLQRARSVMEDNDPINARDIFGTPTIHGAQPSKETRDANGS